MLISGQISTTKPQQLNQDFSRPNQDSSITTNLKSLPKLKISKMWENVVDLTKSWNNTQVIGFRDQHHQSILIYKMSQLALLTFKR